MRVSRLSCVWLGRKLFTPPALFSASRCENYDPLQRDSLVFKCIYYWQYLLGMCAWHCVCINLGRLTDQWGSISWCPLCRENPLPFHEDIRMLWWCPVSFPFRFLSGRCHLASGFKHHPAAEDFQPNLPSLHHSQELQTHTHPPTPSGTWKGPKPSMSNSRPAGCMRPTWIF